MCQMYRKPCACGQKTAEIFFGNMVLDESAISGLYCPQCSATADNDPTDSVEDNGWVMQMDHEILQAFAPRMMLDQETLTAEQVFDADFVTWVGFSPEDNQLRAIEREAIIERTKGDTLAQFEALKQWALEREARFLSEGWRKVARKPHNLQ